MTSEEFEKAFLNIFAKNIDKKTRRKNKIGKKYGGYLWFIFDRKLYPFLEGEQAKIEYDKIDKSNAFEIQYDNGLMGDSNTRPLEKEHLTSKGIDDD